MNDCDVVVVGAGHNGLVAAIYLARAGLSVHVFERRGRVGGAAVSEEVWPGFTFSTCAHMVHGIHPRISHDLGLAARGFHVIPRGPSISLLPDGAYWGPAEHASSRNQTLGLTRAEAEGQQRYDRFGEVLRHLFGRYRLGPPPTLAEVRRDVAGTEAAEVLDKAVSTRLWDLQDEFLPTARLRDRAVVLSSAIERDPTALLLARASLDVPDEETGESPEHGYVRGGMGQLTRILRDIAVDEGVRIHLGQGVDRILVADSRVVGIRLADGSEVQSWAVLSNADVKRTFLALMEPADVPSPLRKRIEALQTTVSAYKLLGVLAELPEWTAWDGDVEEIGAGGVLIGASRSRITRAYDDIDAGRPTRQPLISVSVPSARDNELAPAGFHTLSCYIAPAPGRLAEGSWDDVRDDVARELVAEITEHAPNLKHALLEYRLRTPLDLERDNALTDGCIWHVGHGTDQLLWNRPLPELSHYRAHLPGLYLCGAGQHPAGEVSGQPGHNAAHELIRDLR